MTGPSLSKGIAFVLVSIAGRLVPRGYRGRWTEEWHGEIDASEPGVRLIVRALGVVSDAIACRRLRAREAESAAFGLKGLLPDVRYSLRTIRQSPGFALAAVASLAVGITASATVFGAINALLFRSLPGVHDSTRVAQVFTTTLSHSHAAGPTPESSYDYYRQVLTSFSELAAYDATSAAIATGGEPFSATAVFATPNYFRVLGTAAAAGRLLDESTANEMVGVAAHDFAIRHFGSAAAAVGQVVTVGDRPLQIVGVTPRFHVGVGIRVGADSAQRPQLWLPLSQRPVLAPRVEVGMNRELAMDRAGTWVDVVGRLADGVSWRAARAQADSVPLHTLPGSRRSDAKPLVTPLGRSPYDTPEEVAATVAFILGIPFIVLAIGCANTANLQLARAVQRRAEFAVRRSIGASRGMLVRQLLAESLIVAGLAGCVSVVLTQWLSRLLAGALPIPFPVDWRVLGFACAVAVLTGIGFGLTPALTATRGDLVSPLKDSGATSASRRSRLRSGLVVAQVALSILLLVMAGLFTRTLQRLHGNAAARDMARVAAVTIDLGLLQYSEARGRAFQDALLARLDRGAGIVAAAIVPFEPFTNSPGLTYRRSDDVKPPYFYTHGTAASGRFLEAAGIAVVRGRGFSDADRSGSPAAALVTETLARRMFPSRDSIGQAVLVGDGSTPTREVTIVGVTADVSFRAGGRDTGAMFLASPLTYDPVFSVWVRAAGDPADAVALVRQAVAALDPRLPVLRSGTGETWRDREIGTFRWIASGLGAMGVLALLLAAAGLYAVLSCLVADRRPEMAVRLALGATPRQLSALILGDAMRLSIPGLAVGLLLSAGVASLARALLYGVSPLDPVAFVTVSSVLLLAAVAATLVPALRASRLDPLATLRRQ